jgi:hypothetical protein
MRREILGTVLAWWDMILGNSFHCGRDTEDVYVPGILTGEKGIEGLFCEISPAFRSAASDVSSANRDAFCEAALWRVAIFRGRLVDFLGLLGHGYLPHPTTVRKVIQAWSIRRADRSRGIRYII